MPSQKRYPRQGSYTIDDYLTLPDVQLDKDNKTMVQPDVCVVCDRTKINRARIFGAPDFVVEVLSPSTKMKDILIKMQKYQGAGIREYWMVDPDAETVTRILYKPPAEDFPDSDMKMEIFPFSPRFRSAFSMMNV